MSRTMATKALRKKAAKPANDRVPTTRRAPGKCDHSTGTCFMVKMDGKDYHYPDEPGAVMFALRYSRDLATTATVYDPDGRVIVQFTRREYDINKHTRLDYWRNDELQVQIARTRVQKSKPKKPLRKKVTK